MQRKYRDSYADHCIRHPNDHVSYGNFRWRVRHWGEKLAIRLGKLESAPELAEKFSEKRKERQAIHIQQKQEMGKRERRERIERIILGIALFLLGLVIGQAL